MNERRNRKRTLIGFLLLTLLLVGVEVQLYQDRIRDLQGRVLPDGAFLFTTAVEVAHIDGDGNVVDSVLKVGDLPTENFGYVLGLMFGSNNELTELATFNNSVLKDTTGTLRSMNALPSTTSQNDLIDVSYARIGWGTGTTAANTSQYELAAKADWDIVDQVIYFENSTHMWAKIQMTHEVTSAVTITEVGLYTGVYVLTYSTSSSDMYVDTLSTMDGVYGTDITAKMYSNSQTDHDGSARIGQSYGQYLLFRDVLGSSVTVPANEAVTITYWIYLEYA